MTPCAAVRTAELPTPNQARSNAVLVIVLSLFPYKVPLRFIFYTNSHDRPRNYPFALPSYTPVGTGTQNEKKMGNPRPRYPPPRPPAPSSHISMAIPKRPRHGEKTLLPQGRNNPVGQSICPAEEGETSQNKHHTMHVKYRKKMLFGTKNSISVAKKAFW